MLVARTMCWREREIGLDLELWREILWWIGWREREVRLDLSTKVVFIG